jgi:hypothetical protein
MNLMRRFFYSCLLMALIVFGCGKRQMFDRFGTEVSADGYYETAWVDPQIVVSDSLFTLIRAERIDSFYVDRPAYAVSAAIASLTFHVDEQSCFTAVNLLNAEGKIVKPFLVQNLSQGYYKLTVDLSSYLSEHYPDTHFYLKADYCGSSVMQPVGQKNSY